MRAKVAGKMLEGAKDFFAMKTTGAGIIVPIFGDKEITEALAACKEPMNGRKV